MQAFDSIFFGNGNRFCAVCANGYVYVSDAERYDYSHNKRATIIYQESLDNLQTIEQLICKFVIVYPGSFYRDPFIIDVDSLWMEEERGNLHSLYRDFLREDAKSMW